MHGKLAPIFDKRTKQSSRKSEPVLTEAEKQALEVKRAFLTSGVPEELKRQITSMVVPDIDALPSVVWPTDSHVQQRPVAVMDTEQLLGHFDPWRLESCDLPCREFSTGVVSASSSLALGLFTDVQETAVSHQDEVCIMDFLSQTKVIIVTALYIGVLVDCIVK